MTIAPTQFTLAGVIAAGLSRVESRFRSELDTPIEPVAELCRHVERYRGKMLRPTLVFLAGLAVDPSLHEPSDDLVTVATVLEMIHMATLVHDDVLDEADVRRGGETVNKRRGNEAAVVLGDYLISKSFHLCSTLDTQHTSLRVGEVTSVVCEGEMLQITRRDDYSLDEKTYYAIIERKTAALIAVACELGAAHAGASPAVARRLHDFGMKIGSAFQIQDDLLDLTGDEHTVGKTLGKDLEKGKLTLPLIHHLAQLPHEDRARRIARLRTGVAPQNGQRLGMVAELDATGSLDYARRTAQRLVDEAKALVLTLPQSESRAALLAVADAVVKRSF